MLLVSKYLLFGMTVSPPCISINTWTWNYSLFHRDDACQTLPFDFKSALSVATTHGLTNPSNTNRFPIVAILSLISLDMVFNRLSKVRLLGGKCDTDKPQAFVIL